MLEGSELLDHLAASDDRATALNWAAHGPLAPFEQVPPAMPDPPVPVPSSVPLPQCQAGIAMAIKATKPTIPVASALHYYSSVPARKGALVSPRIVRASGLTAAAKLD